MDNVLKDHSHPPSFRHYATGCEGRVGIEPEWTARKTQRAEGTIHSVLPFAAMACHVCLFSSLVGLTKKNLLISGFRLRTGGPPFLTRYLFPFRNVGCPVLAFFARAGTTSACTIGFSCQPVSTALTELITCTLSPTPVESA